MASRLSNSQIRDTGIILSLDLDLKDFNRKINQINSVTKALEKQLRQVNKAFELDPKSVDLLTSKTKILEREEQVLVQNLAQFQEGLNELKARGVEENDQRFISLATNISTARKRLEEVRKELALISVYKITQPLDEFSESMQKASVATKELADEFKVLSGLASAALGIATKSAISFEDAFASVKKTVDETANISYGDLADAIREMAKEVPSSANEIAEVVALAGQLGIATENVMTFSRTMIDLGNSTNLSSTEAAEALAKFINVTGSSADDVGKLGSALVWLGNNAATTESDILELAYRLVGAGANMDFTETQILALSTALSSAGLKAEAAGGSVSTVLQNIQKQVNGTDWAEANESLKVWGDLIGISGEQFKKAWSEDAFGTFQKVLQGLATYRDEGGDLISMLDGLGISTIRTTDSMQRLVRVSGLLDEFTEGANRAYAEGNSLQSEASKRYETTASQLKILKNNLNDVAIELGNFLLPKVNELVKKANKWIPKLKSWVGQNQQLITTFLTLSASIAPTLLGISSLEKILSATSAKISGFIKAFKLAQSGALNFLEVISGITPALVLLGTTIGIVATAHRALNNETSQSILWIKDQKTALEEANRVSEERYALIQENASARITELDYYANLTKELGELTDADGNALEGSEARVAFITNELVQAGIVEQDSLNAVKGKYDEVTQAVYDTIEAKKASAIYEATYEMETQALADQAEAMRWVRDNTNELAEAKRIYNEYSERAESSVSSLSEAELTAYANAKSLLGVYDEMSAKFTKANAILDNVDAMRKSFESGEYEEVINRFFAAENDLIGKGADETKELLTEKYQEIQDIKMLDDGSPFMKQTIDNTVDEFQNMATAIGLSVEQALAYINQLQSLNSQANNLANQIQGATSQGRTTVTKAARWFFQSGGAGFNSGGFTSNVTINVSNNGRNITETDVRKWAGIINEQLGGSF